MRYSEPVKAEARRIARAMVKDELKRGGYKIAWVEASEITKAATHLLKLQPDIFKIASRRLKGRAKVTVKPNRKRRKK